jgi:tetratricopeptide (TPR) repeat protein
MLSPHRYSSHALLLLAMLFVTGCFAAASVMSLAEETSAHPFSVAPTELLARLDDLGKIETAEKSSPAARPLANDVMKLLRRTSGGETLNERDTVDAYLIASGVFEARQRDRYARTIDEITAAARNATAVAKTPSERGDALLRFLHAGPMKAGYDAQQTRLSTLLDNGKFNCVSATALYQIVARRLELDVRALSIPGGILAGHAMTIFIEGDRRIDVETTNPDGFDFQAKVKESGGFVIGIKLDPEKGHEVSELGLASLIAQNLASSRGKEKNKDPIDAVQAALIGVALDPVENAKANNFIATINDWAMRLGKDKKYEEALTVMQFGLELLAGHKTLLNNSDILWNRYAAFEVQSGRAQQAVAVIRRGIERGQIEKPKTAEAAPFVKVADELADAKKWTQAIAVLDQGVGVVEGRHSAELREWLVTIHARWAETERKSANYDAGVDVLAGLMRKAHDPREARKAVEYFAQESLSEIEQKDGPKAAAKLLARLQSEFREIEYLKEAGTLCARRALDKLLDDEKYDDAIAALDRYKPLLADQAARDEVGGMVYDRRGRELVGRQEYEQAVKVYADGLKQFSSSDLLQNNVVVAWDRWAGEAMKNKDWKEAIRIYELALESLGKNAHIEHNLAICRKKAK